MRLKIIALLFFLPGWHVQAQTDTLLRRDTLRLSEVTISAYFNTYSSWRIPASAAVIDSAVIHQSPSQTLVQGMNSIAGVRMEERSPGSYRLSIRGSLLRSPFGIRNVKVYMEDFPLTDASGDTYLNLIDLDAINRIEVLKGPDGSLFGANSGGVVRLGMINQNVDSLHITTHVGGGSFGLWHEHVKLEKRFGAHMLSLQEGVQHCDGYRENSALERKYVQFSDAWRYNPNGQFRLLLLYSDLHYDTPGGLTLEQWKANPRAARPATAVLPGAVEQHAGVTNHTFYGGLAHDRELGKNFRHVIAVFGTHSQFDNPFITNYEERRESGGGLRTWVEAHTNESENIVLHANLGAEGQITNAQILNYGNRAGMKDTLQAQDELNVFQGFIFARASLDIRQRWVVEASVSSNHNQYEFTNKFPSQNTYGARKFAPQLMPRFAFSWLIGSGLIWRNSVSRGYSPPTLAEIRSSDNVVNTTLEPESGWNYETGFRLHDRGERFRADLSFFYYQLDHAIVRKENAAGQEYFVNAGGTKQPGIEFQWGSRFPPPRPFRWIRLLQTSNAISYSPFVFSHYADADADYSGKSLPGVPELAVMTTGQIDIPLGIYAYALHDFVTPIALDDANEVHADPYHLFQVKIGWKHSTRKTLFDLSFGVDNIFDVRYSLGNDLNAVGGRYFNPAPGRNYSGGLVIRW